MKDELPRWPPWLSELQAEAQHQTQEPEASRTKDHPPSDLNISLLLALIIGLLMILIGLVAR